MSNRFDELAKALARGLTRRDALRLLGGTLTAAALTPLGAKIAWGDDSGNGCGAACHDAGVPQGGSAWTTCVHNCGVKVATCQAQGLLACASGVNLTVTVSCCGANTTCSVSPGVGVCVCTTSLGRIITCATSPVLTQACCPPLSVCNTAGVCQV